MEELQQLPLGFNSAVENGECEDDHSEICCNGRRAVSSGEPSLDGSIDVDEERGALSDSDITQAARTNTIAAQVKGPSSDALEESCRREALKRVNSGEDEDGWVNVLGSGRLLKKTLVEGYGNTPNDNQWVTIRVNDLLYNVDSHDTIKFITGFSMVIDAWEIVVKMMREGEKVHIKTVSDLAYGTVGLGNIPGNQDQEYSVELVEVGPSPLFTTMSEEELIAFVTMIKERGNFYFKRQQYSEALFVYKRILAVFDPPETMQELRKLYAVVTCNIAVCYIKFGDMKEVLKCTEDCLNLNGRNVKGLLHRAAVLIDMDRFDEAQQCLENIELYEPENEDAMRLSKLQMNRLIARKKAKNREERALFKRMLVGASIDNKDKKSVLLMPYWRLLLTGAIFLVTFSLFVYFYVLSLYS